MKLGQSFSAILSVLLMFFSWVSFCFDVSISISNNRYVGTAYYTGSIYFNDKKMCFNPTVGCDKKGMTIEKEDCQLEDINLSKKIVQVLDLIDTRNNDILIYFLVQYRNDYGEAQSYYFSPSNRMNFYESLKKFRRSDPYIDLAFSSHSSVSSTSNSSGSNSTTSSSSSSSEDNDSDSSDSSSSDKKKKQGNSVKPVMTINVSAFTDSEQADDVKLAEAFLLSQNGQFKIRWDVNVMSKVDLNTINKIILAINSTKNFSVGTPVYLRCDLNGKMYKLGIGHQAYQSLEEYTESTKGRSYSLSTKTEQINIIHAYCAKYEDYTKETKKSGALKDGSFLCVAIEQARDVVTLFQEEQKNKEKKPADKQDKLKEQKNKLEEKQVLQNNTTSISTKAKLFGGSMLLAGFFVLYMYYQGLSGSNLLDTVRAMIL